MGRLRSSFSSSLSVGWAGDPPWGGGCRLREAQPRSRRARTALEESQQSASRRHGRLPPQPTCTSQRSPRTPGTQDTAHSDLGSHSAAPCAFVASGAQNRKSNFTSTISHDYRTCVQPRSGNDALPPSSSSVSGSALVARWLSCVCQSLGGDLSRRGGSGKSLAGGAVQSDARDAHRRENPWPLLPSFQDHHPGGTWSLFFRSASSILSALSRVSASCLASVSAASYVHLSCARRWEAFAS